MKKLNPPKGIVALAALGSAFVCAQAWAQTQCEVKTGARVTPVIELYTSEGCSSCPPADRWLSTLKGQPVVAQAFHVGYWDYIGWVDRFATPAHTARQKDLAALNNLRGIYTPQLVRNGRDWRDFSTAAAVGTVARAAITVRLAAVPTVPGHPRQVNLVVTDPANGDTLHAASLQCG